MAKNSIIREQLLRFLEELSSIFECKKGLRQGDTLSLVLLNLALKKVVRDIPNLKEMELISPYTLFAYADDIILLGESRNDVEENVRKLIKSSCNIGLVINENKTKYMVMNRNATVKDNLHIERLTFEQVGYFKYLGVNINEKNNMKLG
ncbi:Reverse transcriptase domain [Cinara cedri]|uniref:Reverse transcriptase domain n=1 Tax=Cinara cedri TaxID=506608 RepID=A0A5E4MCM1_9HEMI|nr:Reverse transcriptase domain [Cinara cedri]